MSVTAPRLLRIGTSVAVPVTRRGLTYAGSVSALLLVIAAATLSLGDLGIPLDHLHRALTGGADGAEAFVLERLRGPRLVVAVAAGAALAVSGSLFQTVTRNPLASPDVIGLTAGAGAGAATASLFWSGAVPVPVGAVVGAVAAAAAVHVSTGRGFSSPSHVIIAGIGVAAISLALIQYVVLVGMRDQSTALAGYLAGSLSARSWQHALLIGAALLGLLPVAVLLGQRLRLIEMGDELADALGGESHRTRFWSLVVAVALAAAAVAVAGPISFVSLTAPQVAKRVTRAPGAAVLSTALTGSLILVVADLAAQQAPLVRDLPVGILTAGVGGLYLGFLLVREWKKGTL